MHALPHGSSAATLSDPTAHPSARALRALARGGSVTLAASAVAAVVNLGMTVLVTRGFSKSDAGLFFAATSVFLVAVRVSQLGTTTGLVYFFSRARMLGRVDIMGRYLRAALVPTMTVATVSAGALYAYADEVAGALLANGTNGPVLFVQLLALAIPAAVASDVLLAGTRGFGQMRASALVERIGRPMLQLAFVVFAVSTGSLAVLSAGWAGPYLPAAVVAALWLAALLRRVRRDLAIDTPAPAASPDRKVFKEFWTFAVPRAGASVSQIVLQRADIVLLGVLSGPVAAAIYTAATRFLVVGQMAGEALSHAVEPQFAGMHARGDYTSGRHLYQTATCWLVLLTWPFYLCFAAFAPVVLSLFGDGYAAGAGVTYVLVAAMLCATACGMVTTLLNMVGRTKLALGNALTAVSVNIGLDLILIPSMGIIGAGLGWASAILVANGLALFQVHRMHGLHPFGRGTLLAMVGCAVCFGGFPLLMSTLVDSRVPAAAAGLVVGTVVAAAFAWRWRATLQLDDLVRALRRRR